MSESPRLLVLSPNWLGDAVMALPAIDDMRQHLQARVIVAGRRSVAPLFALVPWVDEVVELEWRSRVTDIGALLRDRRRLRAARADVALVLPNSFASASLAWVAGVPQRWGYGTDGRGLLLTRVVPPLPRRVQTDPRRGVRRGQGDPPVSSDPPRRPSMHQGAYYQHLVRSLGAVNGPLTPRIVVPADALEQAHALLVASGWDRVRPLVVFAPGAAYGTAKRWWPTHFARLATDLVKRKGAFVALVGSAADGETAGEVHGAMAASAQASVADLTGRTSLEVLAAVLRTARACVSNDSGAMHVAAAVGVPLTALFGPTNEHETAPLTHAAFELLIHEVSCRPCMLRECPIEHPCMRDLTPDRVFVSVERMLAGGTSAR